MGWRWGGNDGTAFLARYKETFYLPRRGGTISLARHAIFLPSVPFSTAFHLPRATVPLTLCN